MIYWAPLFHFYQPPTQSLSVLHRVVRESYRPLLKVLHQFPFARATVNINGVLTEMLGEGGFSDVLSGFRQLARKGQVEFTGSAKYHPILPLIPRQEALRQIRRNATANRHYFGKAYRPQGFFPPEMAFSDDLVAPILQTGHRWVIVSGIACPETVPWPVQAVHRASSPEAQDEEGLAVFFRDDILSNRISFQSIDAGGFVAHLASLGENGAGSRYLITAMDGETFGHHIHLWEQRFLAEVFQALGSRPDTVAMVTISELLALFPKGQKVAPRASSWSSSQEDLAQNNPYPLWKDPGNRVHRLQWEHTEIALELTRQAQRWADSAESRRFAGIARSLKDAGLHSCQYWWASRRPMDDINLVHRGLLLQREAILNAGKALRLSHAPAANKAEGDLLRATSDRLCQQIVEELLSG